MADYVTKTTKQILKTFDNMPVVLVEVFSVLPEFNGKIYAISQETNKFPHLRLAIEEGLFKKDKNASFGVTAMCIEYMAIIDEGKPLPNNIEKFYVHPKGVLYQGTKQYDAISEKFRGKETVENLSYKTYKLPSDNSVIIATDKTKEEKTEDLPAAQIWGLVFIATLFIVCFLFSIFGGL